MCGGKPAAVFPENLFKRFSYLAIAIDNSSTDRIIKALLLGGLVRDCICKSSLGTAKE
jgi:hypothetical protein